MNRFPYDVADWSVVDGIMYPGPVGWATLAAMIACVVVLWLGNKWEHQQYAMNE